MPKKDNKTVLTPWGRFILACLVWILCPFFLDFVSDTSLVSWIQTHFDKATWFTFLGSYLPATAFGLIALYNTIQIQNQQKQLEALKNRTNYRLTGTATLYRYDSAAKRIGESTTADLRSRFIEESGVTHDYHFKNGFLLQFSIADRSGINGIESITVESVEWKIAGKSFGKSDVEVMRAWITGQFDENVDVSLFWLYKPDIDPEHKINQVFYYYLRQDDDYRDSLLNLDLKITSRNGNVHHFKASFELSGIKDSTNLKAIKYYCISYD